MKKYYLVLSVILIFIFTIYNYINTAVFVQHSHDFTSVFEFFPVCSGIYQVNYIAIFILNFLALREIIKSQSSYYSGVMFSIIFIKNTIDLIAYYILYIMYPLSFKYNIIYFTSHLLYYILIITWSYDLLKKIVKGEKVVSITVLRNGQYITLLPETSEIKRGLHYVIDNFVILWILVSAYSKSLHYFPGCVTFRYCIILLFPFVSCGYYYFLEISFGKTVSKFICRTRVLCGNSTNIPHRNVLIRTLTRVLPVDFFSYLSGNRFHDRWSGTAVVDVSEIEPEGTSKWAVIDQ